MTHCCPAGQRLNLHLATAGADLQHAARKASNAVQRHGVASPRHLADLKAYRAKKAEAADALADHQEHCR